MLPVDALQVLQISRDVREELSDLAFVLCCTNWHHWNARLHSPTKLRDAEGATKVCGVVASRT